MSVILIPLLALAVLFPADAFSATPTESPACEDIRIRFLTKQNQLNDRVLNFFLFDTADRGCISLAEELVSRGGLEVRQGLGVMLVPVLEPPPLEFPAAANALRRQGLEVRRGEPPFVVLQARAHPVGGIAGVEDEQGIRVRAVEFAEVPAPLDERSVVAVAPAPG